MKRALLASVWMALSILVPLGGTARGEPFTVTVDISSIAGLDFELLFELFDNDGVIGNTSLLVDNVSIRDSGGVIIGPGLIDFEDPLDFGTDIFDGFVPDPLDPGVTNVVPGGFTAGAGGSFLLELTESILVNPTLTFRDFLPSPATATTLQFDFELVTSSATTPVFPFFDDSMVVFIIDPFTFDPFPFIPGLFGFGDVFERIGADNFAAGGVGVQIVPVPGALLLGCIGLAFANWKLQRRKDS